MLSSQEWYVSKNAGHERHGQWSICDADTGANIAVVYDGPAHRELLAAATDLLACIEMIFSAAEDGGNMENIDWQMLRDARDRTTRS